MAETEVWRGDGDRSAAHHLARKTGTTLGAAVDAINAARRLEQLPETAAAAARRGELSTSQVSAITDAATTYPAAESRVVDQARRSSLQELMDDCARTRAAASADAEARRKRIHDRRCLRTYTDSEGAWHMHVRNNAEVGAEIMAAIDPVRDRLFAAARAAARRESSEAYAADALTTLARDAAPGAAGAATGQATEPDFGHRARSDAATASAGDTGAGCRSSVPHGGPTAPASCVPAPAAGADDSLSTPVRPTTRPAARAKIIVRVDLGALLRGYPVAGEVSELVGYGPVAISVIRDLIDSGDPFLAAVATKGVDIVGVAHLGRRPTAHQRTALEWLLSHLCGRGMQRRGPSRDGPSRGLGRHPRHVVLADRSAAPSPPSVEDP